MTQQEFALVALVFGTLGLVVALLGLGVRNGRRDTRLMMGGGAALGGAALLLMSLG